MKSIDDEILSAIQFKQFLDDLYNERQTTILNAYNVGEMLGVHERTVRRSLKRLHKSMELVTIPDRTKKRCYIVFEGTPEHETLLAKEVSTQLKKWKSEYFNNIVKFLPLLKDEKLIKEIGQIQLALGAEDERFK